ncbi:tight adherance operon protein [Izhakiella australiensis]|uniref:Tight adherance operon protein n=1 Tax=Izhakiella australiensis TaxID=1926881 RepID=A0A1S8YTL2_9GAMM|nr:tight adherance operon protein [Izhakiella australiensis]OON42172.1 tight adherance operon protein [Izhakiella australiensis]
MRCSKRIVLLALSILLLSGCVTRTLKTESEINYQEDILLKAKNYNGLITMYRSWLKENDTPESRLKLSRYYYLAGDYKSSLYYLQSLNMSKDMRVSILQAQNMIALGDYGPAIRVTDRMLQQMPNNAEAYNLRGVALALSGKLEEGKRSIERSRELFIADDVAINNLAMIEMIDGRYQGAVGLLLPQYLRGKKQTQILHNLVLSLVKVGDRRYARNIVESENLSRDPDALIAAMSSISPRGKGAS